MKGIDYKADGLAAKWDRSRRLARVCLRAPQNLLRCTGIVRVDGDREGILHCGSPAMRGGPASSRDRTTRCILSIVRVRLADGECGLRL